MSRQRQKYLFAGILTGLLILSACKYFNDFIITPAEAASAVLREASYEKKVYDISEEQMKGIESLYKSAEKFNLPHFEVTKVISVKQDEFLERVIFKRNSVNLRWIMIPKKMGDTDTTYMKRNCAGNYLLQDIRLESREDKEIKDSFTVTTKINYTEVDKGDIRKRYIGCVTFILKKLSTNKWSVISVDTIPFIQETGA
jgi:hypothetical protein